jgi:hypothetical protein
LSTKHLFHACRVLLHAVNPLHGTDGFTSPPKEESGHLIMKIKSTWKTRVGPRRNRKELILNILTEKECNEMKLTAGRSGELSELSSHHYAEERRCY